MVGALFAGMFRSGSPQSIQNSDTQKNTNVSSMMEQPVPAQVDFASVLGESDAWMPGALKSEHYVLGQVALGGDATLVVSDIREAAELAVTDVRGEAFLDKEKKGVNVLLTWKTSRLANAVVHYGKGGDAVMEDVVEDEYGLNHSMILSGLDQSTTYVYFITARDRTGHEVSTDSYAMYTGERTASLFELISGAVTDTFGWAMSK